MRIMNRFNRFGRITLGALALVAATFGFAGCAGGSSTVSTKGNSEAAADSLLARLRASYETTPTLALNGDMKISGLGITIWYDALVRSRDSLRVMLNGPFGIPVGALGATRSEFIFFNAQEGEIVEGAPDSETFGKLVQMELNYDQMSAMFRGELPRFPEAGTYSTRSVDGLTEYTVRTPTIREIFLVSPADLEVRNYTRYRATGDTAAEEIAIVYKDYRAVGGRRFPHKASVSIAGGERKVSITVEKVRGEIGADRSCALELPDGLPRRRL